MVAIAGADNTSAGRGQDSRHVARSVLRNGWQSPCEQRERLGAKGAVDCKKTFYRTRTLSYAKACRMSVGKERTQMTGLRMTYCCSALVPDATRAHASEMLQRRRVGCRVGARGSGTRERAAGGRREAGGGRQEAGGRRREAGGGRLEAGGRRRETTPPRAAQRSASPASRCRQFPMINHGKRHDQSTAGNPLGFGLWHSTLVSLRCCITMVLSSRGY